MSVVRRYGDAGTVETVSLVDGEDGAVPTGCRWYWEGVAGGAPANPEFADRVSAVP